MAVVEAEFDSYVEFNSCLYGNRPVRVQALT